MFEKALEPNGVKGIRMYIVDIRQRTAGAQGWVGQVSDKHHSRKIHTNTYLYLIQNYMHREWIVR